MQKENEEKILEKLNSIEERIQLIEDKMSQGISSREVYKAVIEALYGENKSIQ